MELPIQDMFRELEHAPRELLPSRYWEVLNAKNLAQLAEHGYENFKRTLARNYFTWIIGSKDTQVRFLRRHLPAWTVAAAVFHALRSPVHPPLSKSQSRRCELLGRLLWEYALAIDSGGVLSSLEEPEEGNPPHILRRGKLISQDLANSFLEFRSVASHVDCAGIRNILELGAGYGRTAFVYLKLLTGVRYVVVDIPPALAVCERYLSSQFRDRRLFAYRPFRRYEEIRQEFEASQIAFLLPHQMALLPDRSVDLFVNISSLHEMRIDQIQAYFAILRRLVGRYCYLKQWKESKIPYENVIIRESDYPIPPEWRRIYWRDCAVQERFYETLLEVP